MREKCWFFAGSVDRSGYGIIPVYLGNYKSTSARAHRVMYESTMGEIPDGLELDHLCFNRICINPDHLELVTHRINTLRGEGIAAKRASQTHCIRGHAFNYDNTKIRSDETRECRKCQAFHQRKRNKREVLI